MRNFLQLLASLTVACAISQSLLSQVVQLPSVYNFSYSGGALVPDAGRASMAGNSYARSGSVSRGWGPYGSRASGSMFGASASHASVQIIDLRALDDAILSSNVANPSIASKSAARTAKTTGRTLVGSSSPPDIGPMTDPGKWQRVLAGGHPSVPVHVSLAESDIRHYLKMGQEAEAANRVMAARVYYRMAVEAMTPDMQARYAKIMAERDEALKTDVAAAKNASGRQRF